MNDIDEEEISLVIRFVLPKNKSETTCSEDLSYAFDQAQDLDIKPSWIKEELCTSLTPAKTVSTFKIDLKFYIPCFGLLVIVHIFIFYVSVIGCICR